MAAPTLPINRGDKGYWVRVVQGIVGATADGDFGPDTEKHVIAWQKRHLDTRGHPLRADGVVGPMTWGAMLKVLGRAHTTHPKHTPAEVAFIKFLQQQVGERYIFGAEMKNPRTPAAAINRVWDCSELTQGAYIVSHKVDPTHWPLIGDGTFNQYPKGRPIRGNLVVGDLGFFLRNGRTYHVGAYIGNGVVIEAKGHAYGVVRSTSRSWSNRGAVWRRYRKDIA